MNSLGLRDGLAARPASGQPCTAKHSRTKFGLLAKFSGGKATRDFSNFRHPALSDADYLGPRAIIDGRFKLVIHEQASGETKQELFDLEADPAEKIDLHTEQPALANKLRVG